MKICLKSLISMVLIICLFVSICQESLASVLTLPEELKEIEERAFEGDSSLDEVVLPEGIETIGYRAFADSSIHSINLPRSLSYIDPDAFMNTPNAAFQAERDSYAYQWLIENRYSLRFTDTDASSISVDMAIFENNDEIGLFFDPFVCYFELAEADRWQKELGGEAEWSVSQTEGPEVDYWLVNDGPYAASLCVDMPSRPSTMGYEIRCAWGEQEVLSHVTVNYIYPAGLPAGANIPDYIILTPNEENIIPLSFNPASYAFGNEDRVGLENYSGHANWWYEGHELHIIPHNEGTFTGYIALYAGNMYIGKTVAFRVENGNEGLAPSVNASWKDCYTLSWNGAENADKYTVYAYYDEECTELYRSEETEATYIHFNTDVGQEYWFVVVYELNGQEYRSQAVTAEPIMPMPAPENLTAATDEDGMIHLTWDAVDGATGYRIYFSYRREWSPDTEWYSYEGEPGYDELWIDGGERLYIWVCADNGDGPNCRAQTVAERAFSPESLRMFLDEIPEIGTMYVTIEGTDYLSTEGVTDEEELSAILEYNQFVAEMDQIIADYNVFIDQYYEDMASLRETNSDISSSEDENGYYYEVGSNAIYIERECLETLQSSSITDVSFPDSGQYITLTTDDGNTFYLSSGNSNITITSTDPSTRGRSRGPYDSNWIDDVIDALQHADNQYNIISKLINDGLKESETAARTLQQIQNHIDNADTAYWKQVYRDLLKRRTPELEPAAQSLGFFRYARRLLTVLNIGTAIAAGCDLVNDWRNVIEIDGHEHPTGVDNFPNRLDIVNQLDPIIWRLYCLYSTDLFFSALQLSSTLSNFALIPVTGGLSLVGSWAGTVASSLIGEALINTERTNYERLTGLDNRLHSFVSGVVRDSETKEPLSDVYIRTDGYVSYDDIVVRSDESGFYILPVEPGATNVVYTRDEYEEDGKEYRVDQWTTAPGDMELDPVHHYGSVTGIIKDEDTDLPIEGVVVSGGEKSVTTSTGGVYTLRLEEGEYRITFDKEGYISTYRDVIIVRDDSTEASPTMQSCYVIKTRQDLENVANDTSGRYALGANINLSGAPWTPLPWFSGMLDGRGFSIYGMQIEESSDGNSGLFAGLTGAEIKNLTISSANINVPVNYGYMNTGVLCGNMLQGSEVYDSTFSGRITVNDGTTNGSVFTGGVSGLVTYGSLDRCQINVNIEVNYANSINIGGMFAQMRSGSARDCNYQGTLHGNQTGDGSGAQIFVAGIGHTNSITFLNCNVSGSIRAEATNGTALAYGVSRVNHGENRASVSAYSVSGKAYAVGGQDGTYINNNGSISASSWNGNADAAGLNGVAFSNNYGSVIASSVHGDTTAIGVVNSQGQSFNFGGTSASSTYGNHYESDY